MLACRAVNLLASDPARIQRVSETCREVNVLDYGAIADGKSHKLSTLFKSQDEIDEKYGEGRYTLEDEADFVAIHLALTRAKREANEHLPEGDYGLWVVYLPTGVYKINRTLDLSNCWGLNMDFDILPFGSTMISARAKRIYYSEIDGTLQGSKGLISMQLPRHATLVSIGVVKSSTEEASYSVSDRAGKLVFGEIKTDAKKRKGFVKDIEVRNDGESWDGSIRIEIDSGSKSGAGRIFCEYY